MSDQDPSVQPPYLRRITIIDPLPDNGGPPVHVGTTALLDGVEHPDLIDLDEGWSVAGGRLDASIVTFCVPADRVTMAKFNEDGRLVGHYLVDGIPVLTPKGQPWETFTQPGKEPLVRVHAFVCEFQFLAAPAKAEAPA